MRIVGNYIKMRDGIGLIQVICKMLSPANK
jgi:hypothetical protein